MRIVYAMKTTEFPAVCVHIEVVIVNNTRILLQIIWSTSDCVQILGPNPRFYAQTDISVHFEGIYFIFCASDPIILWSSISAKHTERVFLNSITEYVLFAWFV